MWIWVRLFLQMYVCYLIKKSDDSINYHKLRRNEIIYWESDTVIIVCMSSLHTYN